MSNQISQTPTITKDGSEETYTKIKNPITTKAERREDPIIHRAESLGEFSMRVEQARMEGTTSIEAEDHIITHLLPSGLGKATHFTYRGIIICPKGKTDDVFNNMNMTLEQKMFPG